MISHRVFVILISIFIAMHDTHPSEAEPQSASPVISPQVSVPPMAAPLIIGHRGSCGYRPEHTLVSYELAIDQGADYVEPDLVMTKDGVLICRHDIDLGPSTDVDKKFPDRKRKVTVDGQTIEGWFAHDFTLAEVKTLRAREALDFRNRGYDGRFEVPTFEEFLKLVDRKRAALRKPIGIIPEVKHSNYHAAQKLKIELPLVKLLKTHGYPDQTKPCIVQSFEIANLKELAGMIDVDLLQLIDEPHKQPADVAAAKGKLTYAEMMTPAGLAEIKKYAWGVGPWKETVMPRNLLNQLQPPNSWIADAHQANLKVVAYTFRSELRYLAADYGDDALSEFTRWFKLGIDGVFTDQPDLGVRAKAAFLEVR